MSTRQTARGTCVFQCTVQYKHIFVRAVPYKQLALKFCDTNCMASLQCCTKHYFVQYLHLCLFVSFVFFHLIQCIKFDFFCHCKGEYLILGLGWGKPIFTLEQLSHNYREQFCRHTTSYLAMHCSHMDHFSCY